MESKDLRIGNYVQTDNSTKHFMDVEKVESIQHDGINITDGVGNTYETEFEYDFIKPIPLTDDRAVKFGYENLVEMASCFKDESKYSIEITSEDLDRLFVHEAQNLYFMLTEKELELVRPTFPKDRVGSRE